jgi:hypothetical protein
MGLKARQFLFGFSPKDMGKAAKNISKKVKGKDAELKKTKMMTKEQSKLRKDALKAVDYEAFDIENNPLFKHGKQFLTEMMDPSSEAYKKYEAPYMQKFRETNAQTAARFGVGQNSSMAQGMNSQGKRLSEDLASQRTQGMFGASEQGLGYAKMPAQINSNLLNSALQAKPFGYQVMPGEEDWKMGLAKGVIKGGATAIGAAYGGPAGAAGAYQASSSMVDG